MYVSSYLAKVQRQTVTLKQGVCKPVFVPENLKNILFIFHLLFTSTVIEWCLCFVITGCLKKQTRDFDGSSKRSHNHWPWVSCNFITF